MPVGTPHSHGMGPVPQAALYQPFGPCLKSMMWHGYWNGQTGMIGHSPMKMASNPPVAPSAPA